MASFGSLVFTSAGLQAQVAAQAGTELKFSKIKMGDGSYSGNIASLSDLVSAKVTLTISEIITQNSTAVVGAFFSNDDLSAGFYWREIGLYVRDASGKDVLYAYANAGANYDYIPATSDEAYAKWIRVATAIGNATNVSIEDYEGILYLDNLTFEKYKAEVEDILIKGGKTVSGNYYSGPASNSGIDIEYIKGVSVQDGTPSPDAPVEIETFGEEMTLCSCGKNLFDLDTWIKVANRNYCTAVKNENGFTMTFEAGVDTYVGHVSTNIGELPDEHFRQQHIPAKPLTYYVLSLSSAPKCFVGFFDKNHVSLGYKSIPTTYSETTYRFQTPENCAYVTVRLGINNAEYTSHTFTKIQLEEGMASTEYETFKGKTEIVINQPLRSLPNGVCDTYENGKIIRRVGYVVLNGSEEWTVSSAYTTDDYLCAYGGVSNSKLNSFYVYCDNFENHLYTDTSTGECVAAHGQTINIKISSERLTENTANGLNAWLASNPITVLYELATPVTEEVTLPTISSWYDWTNVWHNSLETDITWLIKNGSGLVEHINGAFGGQVKANATAVAALDIAQVRNIYAGTSDLTAGVSTLATGDIYLVYE